MTDTQDVNGTPTEEGNMQNSYTDEALAAKAADGHRLGLPGMYREAEILMGVPVEVRAAIKAEAHYISAHLAQRPSDSLQDAVMVWKRGGEMASPMAQAMLAEVTR